MAAPSSNKTNWKLTLSYNGSGFHGWQIQAAQAGLATVQGTLADALLRLTGETVLPQGSGRTDAGVHALSQVCSFSLAAPLPAANLHRALNRILPASIRVLACEEAPPSFHARHSARSKTYEYRLFERRVRPAPGEPAMERLCSPFLAPFVWDCRWAVSLDAMNEAAALLLGTHDFTSMAAKDPDKSLRDTDEDRSDDPGSGSGNDPDDSSASSESNAGRRIRINPVKTIARADWTRQHDLLVFRIAGSGFLHHMVRNIVGTLVEVGRGSLQPADLTRILLARDRTAAGPTAPARGLFLAEVVYGAPHADASRALTPDLAHAVAAS